MPPLRRPDEPRSIALPPRTGTVAASVDVLVVGGGPAGLGAALGAAAAGARTALVERYGFLGGNATAALVMPLMSFHNEVRSALESYPEAAVRLMPNDHGPGQAVVAGALNRLLGRLLELGGALAPGPSTGYTVPFDPEVLKLAAMDVLDDAGVEVLLHALASGVVGDGAPEGVVFETKSGPVVVEAAAIVDCTGDGDVAARAGAPYEVGRVEDGLTQPMTLMFRMVEFDRHRFSEYVERHPDQWRGVHGLWEVLADARAAGELEPPREDLLFFATPHEREVSVNSTRVTDALGIDVWDLSVAEWAARRQMWQIAEVLRRRVPGFAEAYPVQSGTTIGVRETRRILGEYRLTAADVLEGRAFDDAIARGAYPIDIHDPAGGGGTRLIRLPPGAAYDIPLRCLVPLRVERMLVAGRCISGSHEAHSSYRVSPIAMATGQAAGVCAALAARSRRTVREIDAAEVQRELLHQGASLAPGAAPCPRPGRPRRMTRDRGPPRR